VKTLEFYLTGGASYPYVEHTDFVEKSHWINYPNKHFKPILGQKAVESYLDQLCLGEKLGFDGVFTPEQHGTPNGLIPSALMIMTWVAAKTSRIRVGAVGPVMNNYQSPMRLAEEFALFDNMSRGRSFIGLPAGHGQQYHTIGIMNPATARERYWEAHDFLIKAFSDDGPFEWQGKYFNVPYANLWPKPLQRPHPPIWIPSSGSFETLDAIARLRYTNLVVFQPLPTLERSMRLLREAAETRYNYELDPKQIALTLFVWVAETDEQARKEFEPHLLFRFQNMLRSTFHDAFPPGHMSVPSLQAALKGGYRHKDFGLMTFEEYLEEGWVVCGSPDTVSERIDELTDRVGAARVVTFFEGSTMPEWMLHKSMTMFAEEVMPNFRPADGLPVWERERSAGYQSVSEYAARREEPPFTPEARIDGFGVLDVRTAHIDDLRVPTRA
jgi:alkanesulfonate monooxygenase SsuD/methylene tetrahydromethanopterin reductase-like flavin-dependent oxidoreductase (luciferase family)